MQGACGEDALTAACHCKGLCGAKPSGKCLLGLSASLDVSAPSEKPQVCPQSTDCFLSANISVGVSAPL